jgi:hypothetical protein
MRMIACGAKSEVNAIPSGYAANMRPSIVPVKLLPGGFCAKNAERKVASV